MKDFIFDNFQNDVDDSLLRHKSILDILTKYSESSARVNRAVAKAVTNCGCIKINADKQSFHQNQDSLENFYKPLDNHIKCNVRFLLLRCKVRRFIRDCKMFL